MYVYVSVCVYCRLGNYEDFCVYCRPGLCDQEFVCACHQSWHTERFEGVLPLALEPDSKYG